MSHGPLARHENVLNILGYGWNFRGSGSIPFLVTEYASSGTLRAYLRQSQLPSRDRLLMCVNVARGLHELHLCGMAHGDLKLDNVLVTPQVSAQSGPEGLLAQSVVAKISDFGHSLLLYEDDEAKDDQKYGGTLAYNAPEISRVHGLDYDSLNFRKCDVWALGLLCWEALDHGSPYYRSARIQDLVSITKPDSRVPTNDSPSTSKGTSRGTASTTESILESLSIIAGRLQEVALDFLESETVGDLYSFEKGKLRELFQATLDVNPDQRVADIPLLPLLLKAKYVAIRLSIFRSVLRVLLIITFVKYRHWQI
jgi:serine/threonine protein kinase